MKKKETKKIKKTPEGAHKMPDGKMMSDKEMKSMMKNKKTSHYKME